MGGEGMPWNIILMVGLIGFAMGLNSGFASYRIKIMNAKYEEREQMRKRAEEEALQADNANKELNT